jgi:inner membrane protein
VSAPWIWLALGLFLGILEILLPGWIFAGFAIGALGVGIVLAVGGPLAAFASGSVAGLLLLFAALSLAAWAALRFGLGVRKGQVRIWRRDINEKR